MKYIFMMMKSRQIYIYISIYLYIYIFFFVCVCACVCVPLVEILGWSRSRCINVIGHMICLCIVVNS